MGLLFRPDRPLARCLANAAPAAPTTLRLLSPTACCRERAQVVHDAIRATMADEPVDLAAIFCDDVVVSAPTVAVTSRRELEAVCQAGDDALFNVALSVDSLDVIGDKVIAEWRMTATFGRAFLLGDDRLIEPTGRVVRLAGATIAEFDGDRVRSLRHYLDDASLLEQLLSLV
jgi:SnoaL-like domain